MTQATKTTQALAAWRRAQDRSRRALLEALRGFRDADAELHQAGLEVQKALGAPQALGLLKEVLGGLSSYESASAGRHSVLALTEVQDTDGLVIVFSDLCLSSPSAPDDLLDLGEALRDGERDPARLARHLPRLKPSEVLALARAVRRLARSLSDKADQVRKALAAKPLS